MKDGIVQIHGKDYMTVAKRVELAHAEKAIEDMETEVIATSDNHVVVKATIKVKGVRYSGISSIDLSSAKMIEKSNPYEVAETSAVGRALGFAGYGIIEGIASADEMNKSANYTPRPPVALATSSNIEDLPERQIDEEPPMPGEEVVDDLKCHTCGQPSTRKTGEKNGKQWVGYFCASGIRNHTRWQN